MKATRTHFDTVTPFMLITVTTILHVWIRRIRIGRIKDSETGHGLARYDTQEAESLFQGKMAKWKTFDATWRRVVLRELTKRVLKGVVRGTFDDEGEDLKFEAIRGKTTADALLAFLGDDADPHGSGTTGMLLEHSRAKIVWCG